MLKSRHAYGVKHGSAKFSEKDVLRIRDLLSTRTPFSIAKEYNVRHQAIRDIKFGVTWKHLTPLAKA